MIWYDPFLNKKRDEMKIKRSVVLLFVATIFWYGVIMNRILKLPASCYKLLRVIRVVVLVLL